MRVGSAGRDQPYEPAVRTVSGTPRLPALDGFRAFAIMGIVAVHLLGASGVIGTADGTTLGVVLWSIFGNTLDAFFIISGLSSSCRRSPEAASSAAR